MSVSGCAKMRPNDRTCGEAVQLGRELWEHALQHPGTQRIIDEAIVKAAMKTLKEEEALEAEIRRENEGLGDLGDLT